MSDNKAEQSHDLRKSKRLMKQSMIQMQSEQETQKMDIFIAYIYEESDKIQLKDRIISYVQEHGEQLINLRDSTGNCLIHHICTILEEGDEALLESLLKYLMSSADDDDQKLEDQACMNFMRGIPISLQYKKETLEQLGIDPNNKSLSQIIKINAGNSFGQTPLHLLSSLKKSGLLMTFLSLVFGDGKENLIYFNPNVAESTSRSFLHILLEKGMVEVFEQVTKKYGHGLDLQTKDMFQNSALMTYKNIKRDQLDKLKQNNDFPALVNAILSADLNAFTDVRNLLFDRELGTNILTNMVQFQTQEEFINLLQELQRIISKGIVEMKALINVHNTEGSTIAMKVLQNFNYQHIMKFLETIGDFSLIEKFKNAVNQQNLLHYLFGNKNLNVSHKNQIFHMLLKLDHNMPNQPDYQGNLPINFAIQRISNISTIDEIQYLDEIFSLTPLDLFCDPEKFKVYYEGLKQSQEAALNQRKELNYKREKYQSKSVKQINKMKPQKPTTSELKSKIEQLKTFNSSHQESAQHLIISPLECAIKMNQIKVAKKLMEQYQMSPLQMSSNLSESLIEIAAQLDDLDLLKICAATINDKQIKECIQPIRLLLRLFNIINQRELKSKDIKQSEKIKNIYKELANKVIKSSNFDSIVLQEVSNQEKAGESEEQDDDESIKFLKKKLTILQSPITLSAITNSFTDQILRKVDHLSQIILLSAMSRNWILLDCLKTKIAFIKNDSQKNYFDYRIFKEVAIRNDKEGMQNIIKIFPDILNFLKSSSDDTAKNYKKRISQSMFIKYRDIQNPDAIEFIRDHLKLIIIPHIIDEEPKKAKIRDQRYQLLPTSEKNELFKLIQGTAFKHILELIKRNTDFQGELDQVADIFLKSKSKQQYLITLTQEKVLFQTLDIRLDAHQGAIQQFINSCFKVGNFQLVLQIFEQLKTYLHLTCSFYPLNYYAEVSQFERNYPYREFKLASFIRKINLKNDQYPLYHGEQETMEIDDDQETLLTDLWTQITASKQPIYVTKNGQKDFYVPNGNALLYKMFVLNHNMQMTINRQNYNDAQKIFEYIFEFGGFPIVEVSNLRNLSTLTYEEAVKLNAQNKIMMKFHQCLKQKSFQTILHLMALDQNFDQDLLKKFCQEGSLQAQNFNSKDSAGRSPITLAIDHKNLKFLEIALGNSPYIYLDKQGDLGIVFSRYFQESTIQEKVALLKLLSQNLNKISPQLRERLFKGNTKDINYFLDVIYSINDANTGERMQEIQYQIVYNELQSMTKIIQDNSKPILETFKLQRQKLNQLTQQGTATVEAVLYQRQMTTLFQLGHVIHQIGTEISLEQLKSLESKGYNLCNNISPAFSNCKKLASKIFPVPQFFPFDSSSYQLSYLLKYVLLNQPKNLDLINYIFSKLDLTIWKPFLFEIMIFIGKILGTKNELFKKLFTQEKAYMMGKLLTVESRLRSFSESYYPNAVNLYYNETCYKNLLSELMDLLVINNELTMFTQFINDQCRFFLCKEMIQKGLESCCRNFQPRIGIILAAIGSQEDIRCVDQANLMPNLDAKVTMKDIQETAIINRCLENWKSSDFFKKVRILLLKFQATRDMIDEFLGYIMGNDMLRLFFNFDDKEKQDDETKKLFINMYQRCSPKTIEKLLPLLQKLCTTDQGLKRLYRSLIVMPRYAIQSVTKSSFSNKHTAQRRSEMKLYLSNKVESLALDTNYFQLIADNKNTQDLIEALGVTDQDYKDFQNKAIQIHTDYEKLKDKKFVFGEYQSLIGVFKLHNQNSRPNRSDVNSIRDMQEMSEKEIKALTKDQLKTKSENLIMLYEYLVRQDQKRQNKGVNTKDNRNASITDLELRELMFQSQPTQINLHTLFSAGDNLIVNNDFEDIIQKQKYEVVKKLIDVDKIPADQVEKYLTKMTGYNYLKSSIIIPMKIKLLEKLESIIIAEQPNQQFEDDDARAAYLTPMIDHRNSLYEEIKVKILEKAQKKAFREGKEFIVQLLQPEKYRQLLQMNGLIEGDYDNLFKTLAMHILIDKDYYQAVRQTFLVPLIKSDQFDFVFEEDFHEIKHQAYFQILLQVFAQDDEDLQKAILSSEKIMRSMREPIRKLIFCVLASKPVNTLKYVDSLLKILYPWLVEYDTVDGFGSRDMIIQYKFKFLPPSVTLTSLQGGGQNEVSASPIAYLIRTKRFSLIKFACENRYLSALDILVMLQGGGAHQDKPLLQWMLDKNDVLLVDAYPKLCSWLFKRCDEEAFKMVNKHFGEGKLLEHELSYQRDEEQHQGKYGIIHEMIHEKHYEQVATLLSYANEQQKEELCLVARPWYERESTENDKILPFTYALACSQFQLCKLLLPPDDKFDILSYKDHEQINDYLKNHQVLGLTRNNPQTEKILTMLSEVLAQSKQSKGKQTTFQFTKKILLLPELLRFVWKTGERQFKIPKEDDENEIEEGKEQELNDVNFNIQSQFNHLASQECGIIPQIDVFLLRCGLKFNKPIFDQKQKKEYALYMLEKGFNLERYFKEYKQVVRPDLLYKPYSFFVKANQIQDIYSQNQKVFEQEDLKQQQREFDDEIYKANEELLNQTFGHDFKEQLMIGFASNRFALTYYLLNVQNEMQILQDLDVQQFNNNFWNIQFETLSHDILIVDMIQHLFPEKLIFQVILKGYNNADKSLFYDLNNSDQAVATPQSPRFLAFLLYLLNHNESSAIFTPHEENEDKSPEALSPKQIISDYLNLTQKYIISKDVSHFEFSIMVNKLKHLGDALELYEKTFSVDQSKSELYQLQNALGHKFTNEDVYNQYKVNDQIILEVIQTITDFQDTTYLDYFKMKFELEIKDFSGYSNNQVGRYSQSLGMCRFITRELENLVILMNHKVTSSAPQIFVDYHLVQNQESSIKNLTDFNFYCVININDLKDEKKLDLLGNQLRTLLNRQKISQFLDLSAKQLKAKLQVKEEVTIGDKEFIKNFNDEECQIIEELISQVSTLDQKPKQKKGKCKYSLYDLVMQNLNQYVSEKVIKEKMTYNSINISYMPLEQLIKDRQDNYAQYLQAALSQEIEDPSTTCQVIFTFDLKAKNKKVLLHEAAFIPIMRLMNAAIEDTLIERFKMHNVESKFQEIPSLNIKVQSLYQNVLKHYPYTQIRSNPFQVAQNFFLNNNQLLHLLSISIENMADEFRKETPKSLLQGLENEQALKHAVYNLLKRIDIEFDLDIVKRDLKECLSMVTEQDLKNNKDAYEIVVTDVRFSTIDKSKKQKDMDISRDAPQEDDEEKIIETQGNVSQQEESKEPDQEEENVVKQSDWYIRKHNKQTVEKVSLITWPKVRQTMLGKITLLVVINK